MIEIVLTVAIYGGLWWWLGSGHAPGRLDRLSQGLRTEHAALIMLLLASHARVARSGAADSLSSPLVIETALRGVFVLAALALIVPLARSTITLSATVRRRHWAILALVIYTGAAASSTLYAVGFLQTAGKVAELATLIIVAWHLASRQDASSALMRTLYLVVILEAGTLLVSVLGYFLAPALFARTLSRPGFVFATTLEGPLGSANDTAATGGLLVAVAVAVWMSRAPDRRRWIWPALIVTGLAAVILASGRQGVAIMIGAVAVVLWVRNRRGFVLVGLPTIALIWLFGGGAILEALLRDQPPAAVETLSGRTVFWDAAISAFQRQPLSGYGFGGSKFSVLAGIGADQYTHLHNGYLEALVGVGLIGFVPLMVAVFLTVRWCVANLRRGHHVPLVVMVPALLAQNAIGQGFGGWLNTNLVLFALLAALADVQGRSATTPPRDVGGPLRRPRPRARTRGGPPLVTAGAPPSRPGPR
jgi:O-antigen ligase